MRSTDRFRGLAGPMILVIGLAVAGCSASTEPAATPSTPKKELNVTQTLRIPTLPELTRASKAVVVGVAKQSTTTELRGMPITVTEVTPTRTVTGTAPVAGVKVFQLGSEQVVSSGTAKLMTAGSTYLMFLAEENSDGVRRTVLTGADGLYELQGDQYRYAGGQGSSLPESLPVSSIDTQIAAASKKAAPTK